MADWQTYHEGELPIPAPPVQVGWEDMRQRLDNDSKQPTFNWQKLLLTVVLLLSWLVLDPLLRQTTGDARQRQKDAAKAINPGTAKTADSTIEIQSPNPASTAPGPETRQSSLQLKHDHQASRLARSKRLTFRSTQGIPGRKHRAGRSNINKNLNNKTVTPAPTEAISTSESAIDPIQSNTLSNNPATEQVAGQQSIIDSAIRTKAQANPSDSAGAFTPEAQDEHPPAKAPWQFWFGPQWEMPIPTTGTYGFFHGPDNSPEAWRYLVPGIWLEATHGKDALNIGFMPMHQQLVKDDVFRVQNSISQTNDTTISREDTKHLYKLMGVSTSLGYARNLHGPWWGGLSFQATWWRQALAVSDVKLNYVVAGQSVGQEYFPEPYRITDEWSYFNRMQTFVQADLTYRKRRWQSGLRTGISLTPLSRQSGPGHIFRMSAFFRLTFGK